MDFDSSDDYFTSRKKIKVPQGPCPYIHTVNRFNIDFDFEKVCSVTLSNTNVYACLVCGKYFQGRGKASPAYVHSVEAVHHIFINLSDERFWCIPEDYEIFHASLDDIKVNLNPRYNSREVKSFPCSALSLTGSEFIPGIMGLNQIKADSYFNATVHALCAVDSLRNFFLLYSGEGRLTKSLSELLRKMSNPKSFKGIVSPHEFLQAVSISSKNQFSASYSDPGKFLTWLLPALQAEISTPEISRIFQGATQSGRFLMLDIDLPVAPVFKTESEFIPTVWIQDLLSRRFSTDSIEKFPETLILCFKRFVKNNFFKEKNSTIVRFPLENLDLSAYGSKAGRGDYSLVSMICHEGKAEEGHFRSFVLQRGRTHQWFECDGLRIKKQLSQSVALVESYVQIWSRNDAS